MSYMSEKKAQEIFVQQMQAELTNDDLARELEKQLNEGGWYITNSPEGATIQRKDTSIDGFVPDWLYMPKESTVAPTSSPTNESPNRGIWIAVGISLVVIIVVITAIVIIKKRKQNVPQLTEL
jgi:predicted RNA-binding protein YlxR (DUF448 family)